MRRLIVLLVLLLTACTVPQPAPTETAMPEPQAVTLDGTLQTSLLATTWSSSPEENVLFPIDPARGTPLPGYKPISLGYGSFTAYSPNRQTLAVVSFPTEATSNGSLSLIDLRTWTTRHLELELQGWVSTMAFRPDGKRLAVAYGDSDYNLMMIDTEQGKITAQIEIDSVVSRLQFTRSGEALMLYSPGTNVPGELSPTPPQILLREAADLSPRWSATLEEIRDGIYPKDETVTTQVDLYKPGNALYFSPGLAFAPDQNTLYIVHADSWQLTTVDFEAQKIETVAVQPRLSWFERLLSLDASVAYAKVADGTTKQVAISPDGRLLYVVGVSHASFEDQQGVWQVDQTPLGLEIIQTSDGSRVEHVETDASELALSPDGNFLYLRNWGDGDGIPWTEIYDTAARKIITREEAFYATPALMPNGQFLLASTYVSPDQKSQMSIRQPSDLHVLSSWTGPEFIYWLTP